MEEIDRDGFDGRVLGGFAGLALPLAGFFAAARLGLILVIGLAFLRFIALPCADEEPLRALTRSFDFFFPMVARFFRWAIIATSDEHMNESRIHLADLGGRISDTRP